MRNEEYEFLTSQLQDMARCGHDSGQIDWCNSCKARQLLKIIVESYEKGV
jgi:hypothetical protein